MSLHCYGKMTWILKYPVGEEKNVCSCASSRKCLKITREHAERISGLSDWLRPIYEEEREHIDNLKMWITYLSFYNIPHALEIEHIEDYSGIRDHPETSIKLVKS